MTVLTGKRRRDGGLIVKACSASSFPPGLAPGDVPIAGQQIFTAFVPGLTGMALRKERRRFRW